MHLFHVDLRAPDGRFVQRFLVVELPPGQMLRGLLEQLYNEVPAQDRTGMSIIVRPQVKYSLSNARIDRVTRGDRELMQPDRDRLAFLIAALSDSSRAFARFPDQCMYILGSENFEHFISKNVNPHADQPDSLESGGVARSDLINAIRDFEIDHLVETSKARLPPIGNRTYKAPSGRHVKSFLRVGNIQQSRPALDAIFFWLLPYLRDCVGIITDTWSISSISQNVSRRLVDYTDSNSPCPIEMLADYHDTSEAYGLRAADIIERFVARMANGGRKGIVLVLISATHTGSLQQNLANFLETRRLAARVKYVSLFRLSKLSRMETLRDYSDSMDFGVIEPTPEQERSAIAIDGSIYFPVQRFDVERVLSLSLLEKNKDFVDRYGEISFARVHHTDKTAFQQERHHAVWIDTGKLIRHPAFVRRLQRVVASLQPAPNLIVSPDHPVARELAGDVAKLLGLSTTAVVEHEDLRLDMSVFSDQALSDKLRECGPAGSLLIVDDGFVTGARITAYQMNLRRTEFKGTMHYLAAIARPNAEKDWLQQKGFFERAVVAEAGREPPAPNMFLAVEEMILPNWNRERCPWCLEHDYRARLPAELRREAALRSSHGLAKDIFLAPENSDEFSLLKGSYFGTTELEPAGIFALVSSCLQSLRTVDKDGAARLGQDYFLVSAKIAKAEYLKKFTDEVLVASLLRAATSDELVYSDPEADRERTLALTSMGASRGRGIRAEIYFAAVCGKLPSFDLSNTDYVAAEARPKARSLGWLDAVLRTVGLARIKK